MRQTFRFLITTMVVLILIVGQGLTAFSAKNLDCCLKKTVQEKHACCHHHVFKVIKPVKSFSSKAQSCFCEPHDNQASVNEAYPSQTLKLLVVSTLNPQPFRCLQSSDSDKPIWLYWQFYPDQSRLYQQKNSWLL